LEPRNGFGLDGIVESDTKYVMSSWIITEPEYNSLSNDERERIEFQIKNPEGNFVYNSSTSYGEIPRFTITSKNWGDWFFSTINKNDDFKVTVIIDVYKIR
jgi:hypothetical protein